MEPLKHAVSPVGVTGLGSDDKDAISDALTSCLPRLIGARQLYLGFSGGLDSRVLLAALMRLAEHYPHYQIKNKLTAVHVHHGLNAQADAWAEYCQCVCQSYQINFICEKVSLNLSQLSSGLEAAARTARYGVFKKFMQESDLLLLGQHGDDQIETVLLQLFRGAGPQGLAAMAKESQFSADDDRIVLRPLLELKQIDLAHYARDHQLDWVHDDSNDNLRFERNFLRHQVLPNLHQRYPGLIDTVGRSARLCAEHNELLNAYVQEDLVKHLAHQGQSNVGNNYLNLNLNNSLCSKYCLSLFKLAGFEAYSLARQKALIRAWLAHSQVLMPSEVKLTHLIHDVCLAKVDAQPMLTWGHWLLRRYHGHLYLFDQQQDDSHHCCAYHLQEQTWGGETVTLENGQVISSQHLVDLGVDLAHWDWQGVTIGLRQGGERFHPQGHPHSQPLKKFLHAQKIPPWLREQLILVKRDQKIVAILGLALAAQGE
ncbi:tRNA lysidine(34) synthetase TilS [Piscirickettsia salmonis]|uniref:tRNA lysidine(34) synthetase TilS n=1 Tax=Piscirickettsia salmonis TaxID=1238 RepID=UPI000F07DFB2|nr:tRNA lysidine(34) synthetase TilS [Piscirickettsiaceae bacterium NZ-RLO2]